jgi:hypothetical protein
MANTSNHGRALAERENFSSKEVILQRRIFPLLFLIAGFLFSNSVQAQTPVDANGTNELAPTGTFPNVTAFGGIDVLFAHNGGTITGTGNLELDVTGPGVSCSARRWHRFAARINGHNNDDWSNRHQYDATGPRQC